MRWIKRAGKHFIEMMMRLLMGLRSVPVTITGGPASVETKDMPRHKKNPAVGTKRTVYASEIIIDQADAQSFAIDEEVGHRGTASAPPFQLADSLTLTCFALFRSH
jgi:tRNA synthetases class I (E and Q), anti-codon binding domain